MRTLLSLLIATIFVVFAVALFVTLTLVGYAESPEALVVSSRRAELRSVVVDTLTVMITAEEADAPLPAGLDEVVRLGVEAVVTEAWVDETMRALHAASIRMADGTDDVAAVPLHELKRTISKRLVTLEDGTEQTCDTLFGKLACGDPEAAAAAVEGYRHRVERAMAAIPDEIDFGNEVRALTVPELGLLRTVQNAVVAGAGACLLLLALLHRRALRRALGWLGGTLFVAALGCLLVVAIARFAGESALGDRVVTALESEALSGEAAEIAAGGARRLAAQIVTDATSGHWQTLLPIAGLGWALIVFGRVRRPAKRDDASDHLAHDSRG